MIHPFPEEGGVIYHPFLGELHALDQVAAHLLHRSSEQHVDFSTLIDETVNAFPEISLTAKDVREIVDSLCNVGVLRICPNEDVLKS